MCCLLAALTGYFVLDVAVVCAYPSSRCSLCRGVLGFGLRHERVSRANEESDEPISERGAGLFVPLFRHHVQWPQQQRHPSHRLTPSLYVVLECFAGLLLELPRFVRIHIFLVSNETSAHSHTDRPRSTRYPSVSIAPTRPSSSSSDSGRRLGRLSFLSANLWRNFARHVKQSS